MIYIVVDNLQVGGIQRLALDESYFLQNISIPSCILVLNNKEKNNCMLSIDQNYLEKYPLNIRYLSESRLKGIMSLTKMIRKSSEKNLFVSHTPSGSFMIRLASLLAIKKVTILLWIHQVITLSRSAQAKKRIFYAIFANHIYFGAKQFYIEWENYVSTCKLFKFLLRNRTEFSRIGVYLHRVLWKGHKLFLDISSSDKNIVFASRNTPWKQIKTFVRISEYLTRAEYSSILMSYENSGFSEKDFENQKVAINYCPAGLRNIPNLVHLYPTNYGPGVANPLPIGLNVMEFLALGIPSLISQSDNLTYPELMDSELIEICDWNNLEDVELKVNNLTQLPYSERVKAATALHSNISIDSHIEIILRHFRSI